MAAIRIAPTKDDASFPYQAAKEFLAQDADLTPADLEAMIAAGKRMGWTEDMIRANEELARRGLCFDFVLRIEPFLRGTLYENNILFSITGDEKAAQRYIKALAKKLGGRVHKH